ncbi:MAG: mechanosensitive ion channel family protein [Bacteroidota bacterium]
MNYKDEEYNHPQKGRSSRRITVTGQKERSKRKIRKSTVVKGAENRLKGFRRASMLAVAFTGFILLIFSTENTYSLNGQNSDTQQDSIEVAAKTDTVSAVKGTGQAAGEAIGTLQNMWNNFISNYPKVLIAIGILLLSWLLVRLVKFILRKVFKKIKSLEGVMTLTSISLWLLAVGIAFSVLLGDIRALVGSFGLIGLALSWALQTPIESFTGWLMNAFRRYYRVGDRILVGNVFGDVFRIDFLSTTVWEIGSPSQPGFVNAEQATGRMVTFPNNEILSGTIINLTGDFPWVWDELVIAVANESDIPLAMQAIDDIANEVIGNYMQQPAIKYEAILKNAGLVEEVPVKPQVYVAASESWTEITVRYLVAARERRQWRSDLFMKINTEIDKPEYKRKIIPVYPRQQVQAINAGGVPVDTWQKAQG